MQIVWRSLEEPGHEFSRVVEDGDVRELSGVAILVFEGEAYRLDYRVECDERWMTRTSIVTGWAGDRKVDCRMEVIDGRWTLNGEPQPQLDGCIDTDLNFTPSTNLLPIRRLGLAIGESGKVSAAWLRFPTFHLERFDQTYTRLAEDRYVYESTDGFRAELLVNEAGMVLDYEGVWTAEQ